MAGHEVDNLFLARNTFLASGAGLPGTSLPLGRTKKVFRSASNSTAVPLAGGVHRRDEEVGAVEPVEDQCRTSRAQRRVAQRAGQPFERRGRDEQVPAHPVERGQHLGREVVQHVSVTGPTAAPQRQPDQVLDGAWSYRRCRVLDRRQRSGGAGGGHDSPVPS